jgi:membrane fusion protein (multidrug efflux system)
MMHAARQPTGVFMKKVTHYALVCMLSITCAVLAGGCKNNNSQASGNKQQDAKAFPVEVTRAAYANVQHTIEAVGSFFPEDEVKVGAEVEGTIKKLSVDEGAIVKKGDLLLEIDDEKFRLEVEESQAMSTEALRRLENSRATLNRMTRLYKEGVIGQQNYDDAKTQTLLIEANVENIKARLNRFKKSLKDTRVMAPIDGVVSERKVSVGEYVKVGAELFKIVDSNPLKLAFTIPENSAGEIKIGQKVQVQPRAFADKTFQGKIYFINPKVDIETRTVEVKAWVDNPEYTLKPGFYVNVKTLLEERKSMVLPESSVLVREGKTLVMSVVNDSIQYKQVTSGVRFDGKVEILDGITPEDKVVLSGRSEITEGTRVEIISPKS